MGSLVYMSDVKAIPDASRQFLRGAEVVVCDALTTFDDKARERVLRVVGVWVWVCVCVCLCMFACVSRHSHCLRKNRVRRSFSCSLHACANPLSGVPLSWMSWFSEAPKPLEPW